MLIRNALAIMTGLPREKARAAGTDLRIDGEGRIAAIGKLAPLSGEKTLDASDCVIYPGWINTHHHLAQTVLKGVPQGINLPLLSWLESVPYRYRYKFDAELGRYPVAEMIGNALPPNLASRLARYVKDQAL